MECFIRTRHKETIQSLESRVLTDLGSGDDGMPGCSQPARGDHRVRDCLGRVSLRNLDWPCVYGGFLALAFQRVGFYS